MANLIICLDADRITGKGVNYWVCGYEHRELLGPRGECAERWIWARLLPIPGGVR